MLFFLLHWDSKKKLYSLLTPFFPINLAFIFSLYIFLLPSISIYNCWLRLCKHVIIIFINCSFCFLNGHLIINVFMYIYIGICPNGMFVWLAMCVCVYIYIFRYFGCSSYQRHRHGPRWFWYHETLSYCEWLSSRLNRIIVRNIVIIAYVVCDITTTHGFLVRIVFSSLSVSLFWFLKTKFLCVVLTALELAL